MAYAITQTCCNDASCVTVCPVNCIHPTPDEPDFGTTDMLYIDPRSCIDCGACADACPVDAIFPVDTLSESLKPYADVNARFYDGKPVSGDVLGSSPVFHNWGAPTFDRTISADFPALDVAVVGSGPAGMYAVEDLLLHTSARVTLIDRLDVAGGLIRFGVAPDHPSTKGIDETFARYREHPRLTLRLGVEVGKDVTVDELAAKHDAVIYAVGASSARSLGIEGEQLPGSVAATDVVSWYNGHPDTGRSDAGLDLSSERVVLIGNGNVALDVARILSSDPDGLETTSISREALARLRSSSVREVVLLARRGPEHAAYTEPELLALTRHPDFDVVVDAHDERVAKAINAAAPGQNAAAPGENAAAPGENAAAPGENAAAPGENAAAPGEKARLLQDVAQEHVDWSAPPVGGRRRIVLRFHSSPLEVLGGDRVSGLRTSGAEADVDMPAGMVVRAVGYRGVGVPGLPFDEATGTVPNTAGRVDGRDGTYVVGWIKRGPSGGIGANKTCAQETVAALLDDVRSNQVQARKPRKRMGLLRRS
ncbi:FAD-dependent oxidoreductase [Prauserella halophila]|uniref:ferredoxin--NADP(+) reductase n=1 Tax=Prauserella halophila TaxID=185641 RepID=A0ABP4GSF3_9PSEU|nr:FAD-dependent oxidoreductase [Prauserella halophila]MCP2236225.1 ferredoxin--NADP+ reductase [Prauserella halophila]